MISKLTVIGSSGTTVITSGRVALAAGPLASISMKQDAVQIAVDPTNEATSDYWAEKWEKVQTGGTGTDYEFTAPLTGNFYYLATLAQARPTKNAVFLVNDACQNAALPTESGDTVTDNRLVVYDVCAPCLDCAEWETFYTYMTTFRDGLDASMLSILDTGQVLPKYKHLIRHWNTVMLEHAWRVNVEAEGGEVYAAAMFINLFEAPCVRVKLTITVNIIDGAAACLFSTLIDYGGNAYNITTVPADAGSTATQGNKVEITANLDPSGFVKIYFGAFVPDYRGATARAEATFTMEILEACGAETPPCGDLFLDRTVVSNRMVVLDEATSVCLI